MMGQQGWKDGSAIKRTHWLKQEAHEFVDNSDCTGRSYLKTKRNLKTINKQKPYPQCLLDLRNEPGCQWVKSSSFQPLLIDDALTQAKNLRTIYCMSLLENVADLCLLIKY